MNWSSQALQPERGYLVSERLIVRWHYVEQDLHESWFVRGIMEDGHFYGDGKVRIAGRERHASIEGQLSGGDYNQVSALATVILESNDVAMARGPKSTSFSGFLGRGLLTKPSVTYRYYSGDERSSPLATHFLTIAEILRPYLRRSFEEVTGTWRDSLDPPSSASERHE